MTGFVAASSSNVMDISDFSSKFPTGPWNVPTVKQIGDIQFEETKTYVPHKNKVKVIKHFLHHEGFSNYKGGLLVQDVKTKKQFYIDVYNFVTFPYWDASIEVALKQGPVIATYTPTSVKPADRDGDWVDLKPGTEVIADSVENTGRHSGKVRADVYKQWSQGYGGVDVYFDPASLKIKY